jgi:hypothetical protein
MSQRYNAKFLRLLASRVWAYDNHLDCIFHRNSECLDTVYLDGCTQDEKAFIILLATSYIACVGVVIAKEPRDSEGNLHVTQSQFIDRARFEAKDYYIENGLEVPEELANG